jgi:uncharacterized protein (TIGR03435 family)
MTALPIATGLWRLRRLKRGARPCASAGPFAFALPQPVGIMASRVSVALHDDLVIPVTFGLLRPVVAMPVDAQGWDPRDVRQALRHELEHVRRKDWAVHLMARVVCSLHWFNPLAWMALRQLRIETERACDDAVLREAESTAYAQQLVTLARRVVTRTPGAVLTMADRSTLTIRVAAVLDASLARGPVGSTSGATILAVAALVTIVLSPLRPTLSAQAAGRTGDPQSPASGPPAASPASERALAFDATSVRPNTSGAAEVRWVFQGGRFTAVNVSVKSLIKSAYGSAPTRPLPDRQISGGPSWLDAERFDVDAVAPESLRRPSANTMTPESLVMLRTLLLDRFGLRVHFEKREQPVYALVRATDDALGPRLRRSTLQCGEPAGTPGAAECGGQVFPGSVTARGVPMAQVASGLERLIPNVDRAVIDRTGLDGRFDFEVTWTPDQLTGPQAVGASGAAADPNGPSLFTALKEQLGLRLEPTRAAVDVLVIDSVQRPTAN